jgi:hypothetical protein
MPEGARKLLKPSAPACSIAQSASWLCALPGVMPPQKPTLTLALDCSFHGGVVCVRCRTVVVRLLLFGVLRLRTAVGQTKEATAGTPHSCCLAAHTASTPAPTSHLCDGHLLLQQLSCCGAGVAVEGHVYDRGGAARCCSRRCRRHACMTCWRRCVVYAATHVPHTARVLRALMHRTAGKPPSISRRCCG